jgi:hypothetical protein
MNKELKDQIHSMDRLLLCDFIEFVHNKRSIISRDDIKDFKAYREQHSRLCEVAKFWIQNEVVGDIVELIMHTKNLIRDVKELCEFEKRDCLKSAINAEKFIAEFEPKGLYEERI